MPRVETCPPVADDAPDPSSWGRATGQPAAAGRRGYPGPVLGGLPDRTRQVRGRLVRGQRRAVGVRHEEER